MSQTRGMAYLRRKLELKRSRVLTRYKYYEMKNAVKDFGMVTPPEFRTFSEVLGWCGKAVDSLADRPLSRAVRSCTSAPVKTAFPACRCWTAAMPPGSSTM